MPPKVLDELSAILPPDRLMTDPAELFTYESDGFTIARSRPLAVVFPIDTQEVARVAQVLVRHEVPIVPRGSGTGLCGGCVAYQNAVVISTTRMNRIFAIDLANRAAHVQAGVRNTQLSEAAAGMPGGGLLHFSPDPSSQRASTIGGNASTNAGGIHVLRDFVTSNHVLGLTLVLADGTIGRIGSENGAYEAPIDLAGLVCGHEGTFGIVTELWVRLVPRPASFRTIVGLFSTQGDACSAVSDTIAAGHLPSALEMMDGPMVHVIEQTYHFGFPEYTAALLLCEIDGIDELLDAQMQELVAIFRRNHAFEVKTSADPVQRASLWKARKSAFGAIGKISPSYCTQDACVPRSRLREVLARIGEIGGRFGLSIHNIFHAGDGNVHPIFLYDDRDPAQTQNVMRAAEEVLKYCIEVGGTITGEHGVGVEKLHLMPCQFDEATLKQFDRVKRAFDPDQRINAGKVVPSEKLRITLTGPGRHVPQ
ncbi:MAG: FAD-binding protein [Phycisphaerae bacterium]|nr:FAD-binding protein [Phycisphaerae bacterium]MDW8261124.1 FAD-linked oxidase C-terminal domain-containing protein [Phycisphaerales bacterium]